MAKEFDENKGIKKVEDEALASVSGRGEDEKNLILVECPYRDCKNKVSVEKGKATGYCYFCQRLFTIGQDGVCMTLPDQPADGLV